MMGVVLEGEDKKKLDFLNKPLSDTRYFANKATNLSWTKYSRKAKAKTANFMKNLCSSTSFLFCFSKLPRG